MGKNKKDLLSKFASLIENYDDKKTESKEEVVETADSNVNYDDVYKSHEKMIKKEGDIPEEDKNLVTSLKFLLADEEDSKVPRNKKKIQKESIHMDSSDLTSTPKPKFIKKDVFEFSEEDLSKEKIIETKDVVVEEIVEEPTFQVEEETKEVVEEEISEDLLFKPSEEDSIEEDSDSKDDDGEISDELLFKPSSEDVIIEENKPSEEESDEDEAFKATSVEDEEESISSNALHQQMLNDFEIGSKKESREEATYSELVRPEKEFEPNFSNSKEIYEKASKATDSISEKVEIEESYATNGNKIEIEKVRKIIEASLFVVGSDGVSVYELKKILDLPIFIINAIIAEMAKTRKMDPNSGLIIKQFGNSYKLLTKIEVNKEISTMLNTKERKPLSESILEILSIIAYNQPCTKGIVEKIRDKDATSQINRLLDLGLIEKAGKSEAIGKPWLYAVTQKFFDLFGIKSLTDLPSVDRKISFNEDVDLFNRSIDEDLNE